MTELATQIEALLLTEHRWFSTEELCRRFDLHPDGRAFRQVGDHPGLCTEFAVSGNKGFKHIFYSTDGEWDRFSTRIRNHSIRQLVKIKILRLKRNSRTVTKAPLVYEKTTGQAILLS